jgi:hypothetical protein
MNVVKATTEKDKGWDIAAGTGIGATSAPGNDVNNTTLFFNDGSTFTFKASAAGCTHGVTGSGHENDYDAACEGYIDVNGSKGPNKVVSCSNSGATTDNCEATNPTDVYPVIFYDQTILPNSPAARAVLYGK